MLYTFVPINQNSKVVESVWTLIINTHFNRNCITVQNLILNLINDLESVH